MGLLDGHLKFVAQMPPELTRKPFVHTIQQLEIGDLIELSAYYQNRVALIREEITRRAEEQYGEMMGQ